jgi:5'-nucleotidase/UDP-sugar diphosphatase
MKQLKMSFRFGVCLAALSFFILVNNFAFAVGAYESDAVDSVHELVVLHTNDHHGTTLSKDGKMGLAERAAFIKSVRELHKNVLLLDAGDLNTGTALSNMFNAEPDIRAYNMMGYDAVAFGNHEFDKPFSVLENQISISDFDWLSANITRGNSSYLWKPYIIKDFPGFRAAVIGLTTLRSLVTARPDSSLTFIPEIEAAKNVVRQVKQNEKADIVIIVGHLGSVLETEDQTTSLALASALHDANLDVDLIVDGHSHAKFDTPEYVAGIPIVSANEWGKFVGQGVFTIQNKKVMEFFWRPVEITTKAFAPLTAVASMIAPYKASADASLKEVVMQSSDEFEFGNRLPRYKETASGNLVADSYMWYCNTIGVVPDFAITNGGGIRAALPKGNITREAIVTMLPFDNFVFVVNIPGTQVKALFDHVATQNQGAGGFAQVSKEVSYTLTYDDEGKNGVISNVLINGAPINENRTYRIATNDYMAGGGDGYTALISTDTLNTSQWLSSVVIDYAQTLAQPVQPKIENRITVTGGVAP